VKYNLINNVNLWSLTILQTPILVVYDLHAQLIDPAFIYKLPYSKFAFIKIQFVTIYCFKDTVIVLNAMLNPN